MPWGLGKKIIAQDCAVFWFARFYKIRQGASTSAYLWICAGGCNAVDGPKDKKDCVIIFCRGPDISTASFFASNPSAVATP